MSKDGYTLVEMLAALAILALALGGLFQAIHVIGRLQEAASRAVAAARSDGAPQASLDRLVEGRGPFVSSEPDVFQGSASRFSFACRGGSVCSANIRNEGPSGELDVSAGRRSASVAIPGSGQPSFSYVGDETVGDIWPPAKAARERLVRIVLTRRSLSGATPIASVRLWKEQPRACDYDVIAEACRGAAS